MSDPQKFRKRPIVIEAVQVTYDNREDVAAWCGGRAEAAAPSGMVYAPGLVAIDTTEGTMWADGGDWVIQGVAGEFYPCKPGIFAATYEPVADGTAPTEPADELARLRAWKAEAMELLGMWDQVHDALGSPAGLGQSKAAASLAAARHLTTPTEPTPNGLEPGEIVAVPADLRNDPNGVRWEAQHPIRAWMPVGWQGFDAYPFARWVCRPITEEGQS